MPRRSLLEVSAQVLQEPLPLERSVWMDTVFSRARGPRSGTGFLTPLRERGEVPGRWPGSLCAEEQDPLGWKASGWTALTFWRVSLAVDRAMSLDQPAIEENYRDIRMVSAWR
jgi:hypothetical protein